MAAVLRSVVGNNFVVLTARSLLVRFPACEAKHQLETVSSGHQRNYSTTKSAAQQTQILAKYGGRHTVTLMTGDGVGPELLSHVQEIFRYAGAPIDFEVVEINASTNTPEDMHNAILSVKRNGVALKDQMNTSGKVNPVNKCLKKSAERCKYRSSAVNWHNAVTCKTVISDERRRRNEQILSDIGQTDNLKIYEKRNIETKFDDPAFKSMNVALRTSLDLFASIVKCKSIPGLNLRHVDVDCVLIRENTEGEYRQLEHESVPGVVESLKIITAKKSKKIARFAFDYAVEHGRKKVTAIHKANIMKLGDGLFLECCREVSKDYPDIQFNDLIIDNASMQMVSRPSQFDVLCMPNLYGNILSNIAAGLMGGAGVIAGSNIGDNYAVFESGTRNSGRSMKGKNIANPTGMLLASCDLLDYLGHDAHAKLIRESVMTVLSEKQIRTPDIGGDASTLDVVKAVIDDIKPKTLACIVENEK